MKKISIVLALIALTFGPALQASPVSSEKALQVARMVFASQAATKASSGNLKIVWDGETAATKAAVQPAFYVIARDGGGFVIVAGDDNVRPILAISENGRFSTEGMPDNVRWWMDGLKNYVRSKSTQSPEVRKIWDSYVATKSAVITGVVTVVVEHRTPEWDQGNNDNYYFGRPVFNTQCPLQGTELTITGCVATALGEILTYQSGQAGVTMPTSGTGNVGGYTASSGFVVPAARELTNVYDWEALRTLTGVAAIKAATDATKDKVGYLLADLGAIMEAQYSTGNTSAVTSFIPQKMAEHFYMNKGAHYENANDYFPGKWIEMLKAELDKRPIIYNGRNSSNAGHAFVFDGYGTYDGADVFHVNFGWAGNDNGYYYPFNLDTGEPYNYSYNCGAIFDFYPDVAGVSSYSPRMVLSVTDGCKGIELLTGSPIRSGEDFQIRIGRYSNMGTGDFTGTTFALLLDKDGAVKSEVGGFLTNALPPLYGYNSVDLDCFIPSNIELAFGDKIALAYKETNATDYTFVVFSESGVLVGELPVMPAAFIDSFGFYTVGQYFNFHLLNADYVYSGSEWVVIDPDGVTTTHKQSEGSVMLQKAGEYTIKAKTRAAETDTFRETIVGKIRVGD
ncbi:MAG: C10 family peptidase [Bacteroidales bacterium]|nr:C10 family peptidase [Bacteroidales bacterium]